MFLYELAIELGKRSTEVVDAARVLGMADVGPATELSAEQVAALRARIAPPPPPPATLPPPPGAPTFQAPAASSWPAPTGAPVAPPSVVPPSVPASVGAPTGGGRTQVAVIAVVVVLVAGLFGFMVSNTGPDEEREEEIAAQAEELERDLAEGPEEAPRTTTSTTVPAQDAYEPVDVDAFCRGARAVGAYEFRLAAAAVDEDFAELSALVRDRRTQWQNDVATMASGAPPINADDIVIYREGYNSYFDAVESSSSLEQLYSKIDELELAKAGNAGQEVFRTTTPNCS